MTITKKKKPASVSRGQLALVAVLSVVLVLVIAVQLPKSESSASSSRAPTEGRNSEGAVTLATAPTQVDDPISTTRHWPKMTRDAIAQFDPMATPPWYENATVQAVQREEIQVTQDRNENLILEDLQREGAAIVLITDQRRIATVADQSVLIGDKIDGFEVSDITSEGVVLTKSKSR